MQGFKSLILKTETGEAANVHRQAKEQIS